MKKIIVITTLLMGTTLIYAQEKGVLKGKGIQPVSTEDPHNPLVNGIPYDQYKAQVQAEQKKRSAEQAQLRQKAVVDQEQMMTNEAKNDATTKQKKVEPKNSK